MKNSIIFPIIVVVLGIAIERYFFRDKTDVRYNLSDEISTSLNNSDDREIIQQLTLKNIGEIEAKRIIISIKGRIESFSIRKYSESDSIRSTKTKSSFELEYPLLPPNGQIDILIKSKVFGIRNENLEIKHDSGAVKNLFEKTSNPLNYLSLTFIGIYFLLIFFQARSFYYDSFTSNIKYKPIEKILMRKKPLMVASDKWREIRGEAVENYFQSDYSSFNPELTGTSTWKVLDSDKPDYLNEEEWQKVISTANNKLKRTISGTLFSGHYYSLKTEVFDLEKPRNFTSANWTDTVKLINDYYEHFCLKNLEGAFRTDRIVQLLKNEKPKRINDKVDAECKDILRSMYFSRIINNLQFSSFTEKIKGYELSLLTESQNEELKIIIEKIEVTKAKGQFIEKVRELTRGKLSETNNNLISTEDWENIKKLSDEIATILKNKESYFNDSQKFKKLRTKVERQLTTIDKVLSDPTFVTKVEKYDSEDLFSSGNWDNLVKVSKTLIAAK